MPDTLIGWHGTACLDEILETGLDPFPEDKVWDGEDDPALESAGGIYFGEGAKAAAAFAVEAEDRMMSAPGIVQVQLRQADVVADEDRLRIAVRDLIQNSPFDPEGDLSRTGDTTGLDRLSAHLNDAPDPEIDALIEAIARRLRAGDSDRDLIAEWLLAWHNHLYEIDADSRDAHFDALNALCTRLPHIATRDWTYRSSSYHSFRCLQPIGYSGETRILAVARLMVEDQGLRWQGLETLYGRLPEGTEAAARAGWLDALDKRGLADQAR